MVCFEARLLSSAALGFILRVSASISDIQRLYSSTFKVFGIFRVRGRRFQKRVGHGVFLFGGV